jgi:hypothetical protein
MPEFHSLNVNFNGGELSPLMIGRVDFEGYRSGCVQMENFMVRPYGGAFKCPGTQYIGGVKDSTKKTRLAVIRVSREENYVIEVGAGYFRFWNGETMAYLRTNTGGFSPIAWGSGNYYYPGNVVVYLTGRYVRLNEGSSIVFDAANWHQWSNLIAELPNSYTEDDLADLQWRQVGRALIFVHPNYKPRIVESVTYYATGVNPYYQNSIKSIAWSDDTTTLPEYSFWSSEIDFTYPPTKENLLSGKGYTMTLSHAYIAWVTAKAYVVGNIRTSNGYLYYCTSSHTSAAATQPGVGATWATVWRAAVAADVIYTLTFLTGVGHLNTAVGENLIVEGIASSVEMSLAAAGTATSQPRFLQGSFSVSTEWASGSAPVCTLYLESSSDGVNWVRENEWITASALAGTILYEDEAPPQGAWYRISTNITTGVAAARAKIEPNSTVTKLSLKVVTTSGVSTMTVRPSGGFIVPPDFIGYTITNYHESAFSAHNGYPGAVGLHNLRLWFGGTAKEPNRVRGSNVDDLFNFATGDGDSAGFDILLNSADAGLVKWISGYRQGLVIGTTSEEWTLQGGGDGSEVLKPSNIQAVQRNRAGSKSIAAIQTRDALLWVSLTGRKLYEFSYVFSTDNYESPDMTLRAEHITEGGIVGVAFQNEPDPILWCVKGNGDLIGFSYNRSNQIAAWFRRSTQGEFEDIVTFRSTGNADEVWMIVNRPIVESDGKRYIERFYPTALAFDFSDSEDFCYLDCAKFVTQASSTVVSGLNHFINGSYGEAPVKVWADGERIEDATVDWDNVTSAIIELPEPATKVVVGFPFESVLQPETIEMVLSDGTAQGRRLNAERAQLLVHSSLGGLISNDPSLDGDAIGYEDAPTDTRTSVPDLVIEIINEAEGNIVFVFNGQTVTIKFTTTDFTGIYIDVTLFTTPEEWAGALNSKLNFSPMAVAGLANISATVDGTTVTVSNSRKGTGANMSATPNVGDTTATGGGSATGSYTPQDAYTGKINEHVTPEWNDSINLTFRHSDPTPFNLLGFVLKAEVSGQ